MDVAAWLRSLGLERYAEAFRANEIDAEVLPRLTAEDLTALGVTAVGHRRKLLDAIAALRDGAASATSHQEAEPEAAAAAPTASAAERRHLTVLFADLVGSTELAARLDPEDMGRVLRTYHACCAQAVQRWGGYVAKFLGDGVLAYFGYPTAHEDDAERAVRAGLALTEAVSRLDAGDGGGARLRARVGVATGLVVVGELIGEGAAKEQAVVGETPNLAARLQAIAEPSAVFVAPGTRRLLGDLFDLADLGPHRLKGFAEPVRAWRVTGVKLWRSRFEALRRTRRTPLVGRGRELRALEGALRQAAAGQGQVVAAVGEPGVGKSRLFDAFLRAPELDGWRVLSCGCHSYGSGTPWLPVIDLVKDGFGIQDQDDRERITAKLDEGLAPFGAFGRRARVALSALLGLAVDDSEWSALNPPLRRRRILDAVTGFLLLESERSPLVLMVEDLHWADGETLALLDGVVEGVPTRRALLLVNYRPEFQHAWGGRTYYSQLRLDPLGAERAAELLADLLGAEPGLAALKRELIARTGGNPLFLEEAVRDLAETGALAGAPGAYRLAREAGAAVRVPETVQAILAARIDRLPREAKHLLQRAAVIGPDAPLPVLEAVADVPGEELRRRLGELQAAEMLYETGLYPEPEYTFKHALTHEVAYAGLLREMRRELHRRVGEALEALYPERLGELVEALAEHFERGEAWPKAARYALDAAEKAKARYAYPVGMRFAERAMGAAEKDESLKQEWIWASVLRGDLASLIDDLELANRSYDQALAKSKDPSEQRWIANKRHELHYAIRDGAKVAYYVHGDGDETILFVSPSGYGLVTWQPIVERLCQEFRVVTMDMRGTGRSDPLVLPYTDRAHAFDLAAVVHAARGRPMVGVAVSAAPYMLVRAAVADPTLFNKLVLVGGEPGADIFPDGVYFPDQTAIEEALAQGDLERVARIFVPYIISEPGTEELIEQRVQTYLRLPKETLLSFFTNPYPTATEFGPLLERLRVPTLVMHGTADRCTPFELGRRLRESIPGAQLYAFEGRCHLPMITATQEFCDVLREFVLTGRVSALAEVARHSNF